MTAPVTAAVRRGALAYGGGTIDYALLRTDRKSLEIAVHPDKSVVVTAPASAAPAMIEAKIKKRGRWIKKQIAYFGRFDPRTPARRYVGGESHLYLGRKYRLKIETAEQDGVTLRHGFFYVRCGRQDPAHVKHLLETWYRERANAYLPAVFAERWRDFNTGRRRQPTLKLRPLKKRWGSMSTTGQLTLNLRLIQVPRECIEYVIAHELCHLRHHHHGPAFYALLERAMPDWSVRKQRLEMALA